jgi:hypothetical protein
MKAILEFDLPSDQLRLEAALESVGAVNALARIKECLDEEILVPSEKQKKAKAILNQFFGEEND